MWCLFPEINILPRYRYVRSKTVLKTSVVDLNTLNLDPDPQHWWKHGYLVAGFCSASHANLPIGSVHDTPFLTLLNFFVKKLVQPKLSAALGSSETLLHHHLTVGGSCWESVKCWHCLPTVYSYCVAGIAWARQPSGLAVGQWQLLAPRYQGAWSTFFKMLGQQNINVTSDRITIRLPISWHVEKNLLYVFWANVS